MDIEGLSGIGSAVVERRELGPVAGAIAIFLLYGWCEFQGRRSGGSSPEEFSPQDRQPEDTDDRVP